MAADFFRRHGYFVSGDPVGDVQAPDRFNPSGYWEAERLVEGSRAVLRSAGFGHDNTWMYDPLGEQQVERIRLLEPTPEHRRLVEALNRHQPWVWKDPRLCFTLSYWWKLMDPDQTTVVLMLRKPANIIRSFRRAGWREDPDPDRLEACVRQHWAAARKTLRELAIPHVELWYADFDRDPVGVSASIARHCNVQIPASAINFRAIANTSSVPGRVRWMVEDTWAALPVGLRQTLKKVFGR
jgi:hypothetical protein